MPWNYYRKYLTVFWDIAPRSLVEVYRRSRDAHLSDDGSSKRLWNVGNLLPAYTMQHPSLQSYLYSPPREPEILHKSLSYLDTSYLNLNTFLKGLLSVLSLPCPRPRQFNGLVSFGEERSVLGENESHKFFPNLLLYPYLCSILQNLR
jgi:hypothetical protein